MTPTGEGALQVRVLGSAAPPVDLPGSGMLVIGSSSERAGLVLEGQGVDDTHCGIGALKGGGWAVKDLGSTYGTMLNGRRITSARISAGDTIVLGSRRIRIVDPAAPEVEDAADPPDASGRAGSGARVPERIGGHRIDRVLGRGGMGTVLLAEQESLHRPVALKILSPRLAADGAFVSRFQKEARAAAALNHPNVVVVHDVGEADGFHYLSMEYMEGGSLEDLLAGQGRIPWRTVLDVMHDAARGLMFAEERGIVHRDIKPANLMQNAAGTIKIADLGLATHVEAEATESEGRKILGTPHFISPEQARGEAIDNRSDLYSLGATVYRLLTGHTPFEGDTTRDILRGHFTQEPRPVRGLVPEVPEGLDEIVLELLAKDPDDRPRSAGILLERVDRLRLEADHGIDVGAPPVIGGRSRRGLYVGAVVVLAAAALYFGGIGGGSSDEGTGVAAGNGALEPWRDDPGDAAAFAATEDANAGAEGAVEERLERLDLLAENEYLKVDPVHSRAGRIAALADIASRFPGTDTAARIQIEIEQLEEAIREATERAARLGRALSAAVEEMRRLAGLPTPEGQLPRPGDALRQLAAYDPGPELRDKPAFADERRRLRNEVVRLASAAFRSEYEAADRAADEGDFTRMGEILQVLLPLFDLPDQEPGSEPAGLAELTLLGERVRTRLARLAGEREDWRRHLEQADRGAIAAALPGAGLGDELRRLDLEAAQARLAALAQRVGTDESRVLIQGLEDDVGLARMALDNLVAEFAANGWRRKALIDPRSGRSTPRVAMGADRLGIVLQTRSGSEHVPWSAFAARSVSLHRLFKDRLSRPYTPDELRGIQALLRLVAVAEAVDVAGQMLEPVRKASFSEGEGRAILEAFAPAADWLSRAPDPLQEERLAHEREAAQVLVDALLDMEAGAWSSSTAGLERLLSDHRHTLLVGLLSDGSDWREPAADPAD